MIDPLLSEESELIVEAAVEGDGELRETMLNDVSSMTPSTRNLILSGMFKMHKHLESECSDLDISLNSADSIPENTKPWYIIFDDESTIGNRVVRYHYRANWETSHGVEVIVVNGNTPVFVGNCGYIRSTKDIAPIEEGGCSFV